MIAQYVLDSTDQEEILKYITELDIEYLNVNRCPFMLFSCYRN